MAKGFLILHGDIFGGLNCGSYLRKRWKVQKRVSLLVITKLRKILARGNYKKVRFHQVSNPFCEFQSWA